MSTALYRRYRPETFADVIGQEHVTEPLMQALRTGRVGHAYLFSGPRGCGKTTSARILARALNCEQGPTPEPCGVCESCVALARGGAGTVDVIEIDAASHGGVDDARDLRERASYGPAHSRYKVYIIDEAHMVTPQGFNALLKIVEEPPDHVKFVFATTEPEKVIGTIRSRTHHYPFRLVPPARLHEYLEQLCEQEGVAVEPGVLSFVIRAGGGSVRDSLSILDQLIAGSDDAGLTYEGAAALLGFTDAELLDSAVTAIGAGDAAAAFTEIDKVVESGLDPRRFVEDLLERLRDLIIVSALPDGAAAVLRGVPEDQIERMRSQAAAFGQGSLSRAADVVNAGLTEMTGATSPRLQLELIMARVLLPGVAGPQGYAARLDRLERRLDSGIAASPLAPAPPTSAPDPGPRPTVQSEQTASRANAVSEGSADGPVPPPVRIEAPPSADSVPPGGAPAPSDRPAAAPSPGASGTERADLGAIRRAWPDVIAWLARKKRVTWTFVSQNAQVVDFDGRNLVLGISTAGLAETFRRGSHGAFIQEALMEVLGLDVRVEGMPLEAAQARAGAGSAAAGPPTRAPEPSQAGPRAATREEPDPQSPSPAAAVRTGIPSVAAPEAGSTTGSSASGGEPPDPARDAGPPASSPPAPHQDRSASAPAPPESWGRAAPPAQTAPSWARDDYVPDPEEDDDVGASLISDDDEDVIEAGEVGQGVVERMLGGVVIGEEGP